MHTSCPLCWAQTIRMIISIVTKKMCMQPYRAGDGGSVNCIEWAKHGSNQRRGVWTACYFSIKNHQVLPHIVVIIIFIVASSTATTAVFASVYVHSLLTSSTSVYRIRLLTLSFSLSRVRTLSFSLSRVRTLSFSLSCQTFISSYTDGLNIVGTVNRKMKTRPFLCTHTHIDIDICSPSINIVLRDRFLFGVTP